MDKVIPYVPCGRQLVQQHTTGDEAKCFIMLAQKRQINNKPARHSGAIREEFEVETQKERIKLGTHDKIIPGGTLFEPVLPSRQTSKYEQIDTE